MKIGRIPLLALLFFAPAGCGESDSATGPIAPTPDEIVAANAAIVLEAAVVFAADNEGQYPGDVATDVSASGTTLIDLLPGGELLLNPFTGEATEPRDGLASESGQVGYLVKDVTGVNYGYSINAWGEDAELSSLDNIAQLETAVIQNALAVQAVVVAFYETNGRFPDYVGEFHDQLPGETLMVNPFTHVATEPVDGASAASGQVGYLPVHGDLQIVGYTINAQGERPDDPPLFEVSEVR